MNDDKFYNQVAEEIQAKKMLPGLWTKAFAEVGGNTELARAIYIKLRVAQLAEEHFRIEREKGEQLKKEQQIRRQTQREKALKTFGKLFLIALVVFFVLIIALGLLGLFLSWSNK